LKTLPIFRNSTEAIGLVAGVCILASVSNTNYELSKPLTLTEWRMGTADHSYL